MQRRRGPRDNYALAMLAAQVYRMGLENIPPATQAVAALLAAVHFVHLEAWAVSSLQQVCISADAVLNHGEYFRVLSSVLYHGSDRHLLYNLGSFLYKGREVEHLVGSPGAFAALIVALSVLSGALYTALASVVGSASCAVGFSGVIFALKAILAGNARGNVHVMRMFTVPSEVAPFAELVLISVMVPNASFLGHLAGILAGLLVKRFYFGMPAYA